MGFTEKYSEVAFRYRPLIEAYDTHRMALRDGSPRDVMIDHIVVRNFKGDIYDKRQVRRFLVRMADPGDRDRLDMILGALDRDSELVMKGFGSNV